MFLPRKLQKRSNASRTTHQNTAQPAVYGSTDHVVEVDPDVGSNNKAQALEDSTLIDLQNNTFIGQSSVSPLQSQRSTAEAAKLDRLVDFLYMRLSPLNSSASDLNQSEEEKKSIAELDRSILINAEALREPDEVSLYYTTPFRARKPATVHLARLLVLVPRLATRCKSISLLNDALQLLAQRSAVNWFVVHSHACLLEWLPPYIRFKNSVSTFSSPSVWSLQLAPLLVYVESLPPRVRTRSEAAAYLYQTMCCHSHDYPGFQNSGIIVSVLEPSIVDQHLMTSHNSSLPASILEGKWTSGRAFFLLNSEQHVRDLCRTHPWDFFARAAVKAEHKRIKLIHDPFEPIRCLSWADWVDMKEQYSTYKELVKEAIQTQSSTQDDVQSNVDRTSIGARAVHDERKKQYTTDFSKNHNGSGRATECNKWYRGSILLLSLQSTPDASAALAVPPFDSPSQITTAFLNQHLKPRLEQRVPEAVSYIHPRQLPSASFSSVEGTVEVVIRTAHPSFADQLLTQFHQLRRMDELAEDRYWSDMPDKPRSRAFGRMCRLGASFTQTGPN